MNRPLERLLQQPKKVLTALGSLLVALLGGVDYLTGYELSFSIFYVAPVFLVSWAVGRTTGYVLSCASALTWLLADFATGHPYSHAATPYWNAVVRLGFFLIVTQLSSRLKSVVEREREWARTDPLTGAANSRSFEQRAEEEIQRARRYQHPFTLAYLDLDNFKAINDQLGHSTGDLLLCTVADIIRTHIRATDVLARLGGDEFAILFPETPDRAAETALGKLQGRLVESMEKNGWPVSFSIGAVTFLRSPDSVDAMIKAADDAMYAAKRAGKNRIHLTLESGPEASAGSVGYSEQRLDPPITPS